MEIIDFHTHCYQSEVWPKVSSAIYEHYGVRTEHEGTIVGLLSAMKEAGVMRSIVHPVANQAKHVEGVNRWVEEVRGGHDDLVFFAAMHPLVEDPYQAVCDLAARGFKGVKMQPNAGKYYPNTEECFKIYQALEENGMVLMTHAGDEAQPFTPLYAHPKNFVSVFDSFPKLKIVLAHLGGYRTWDEIDLVLGYENAYFDTAFSFDIEDCLFSSLIEKIGTDRILFGTDYPWYDPKKAVEHAKRLLGKKAERIFSENTKKLLGI